MKSVAVEETQIETTINRLELFTKLFRMMNRIEELGTEALPTVEIDRLLNLRFDLDTIIRNLADHLKAIYENQSVEMFDEDLNQRTWTWCQETEWNLASWISSLASALDPTDDVGHKCDRAEVTDALEQSLLAWKVLHSIRPKLLPSIEKCQFKMDKYFM